MSDDQMDARLRDAGERWRAGEGTGGAFGDAAALTLRTDIAARPHRLRPRSRRWVGPVAAAVVVAALAVGGALFATSRGHHVVAATAPATVTATATALQALTAHPWVAEDNVNYRLTFTRHTVRYSEDDCSRGEFGVQIEPGQFVVGARIGKTVTCAGLPGEGSPPPRLELTGAVRWSIQDGRLDLAKPGVASVSYLAAPPGRPKLDGVTWRLARLVDSDGAVHSVVGDSTISFERARFTADDGCNTLSGAVKVRARTIDFGEVVTTAIGCLQTQPARIDAVLDGGVAYAATDRELSVTKRGVGTLEYVRQG